MIEKKKQTISAAFKLYVLFRKDKNRSDITCVYEGAPTKGVRNIFRKVIRRHQPKLAGFRRTYGIGSRQILDSPTRLRGNGILLLYAFLLFFFFPLGHTCTQLKAHSTRNRFFQFLFYLQMIRPAGCNAYVRFFFFPGHFYDYCVAVRSTVHNNYDDNFPRLPGTLAAVTFRYWPTNKSIGITRVPRVACANRSVFLVRNIVADTDVLR